MCELDPVGPGFDGMGEVGEVDTRMHGRRVMEGTINDRGRSW